MIKFDFTTAPVGIGAFKLQFENVAQPLSHGTLAGCGYQLEPRERGLIRYQDGRRNYRVGMLCGGSHWFLLDPEGFPLDREGQPNAGWHDSASEAMNVAAEHARALRSGLGTASVTGTVGSDRTVAPGYNNKIGNLRDVA